MSRIGLGLVLLTVWLLWWGSASPANVLSGIAVIAFLFFVVPTSRPLWPTGRFHPVALVRLAVQFVASIISSNVVLSRSILSPRADLHTGVVKVDLCTDDIRIVTMVTNLTALTPGSMVVKVDDAQPLTTLWVHVLTPGDPDEVAPSILALERRCIEAIGTPEQIRRVRQAGTPGSSGATS